MLRAARCKCRTQKIAICAPSHNFVGLYLRNEGTYRQSEKKNLINSNIFRTCPQNMANFRPPVAEIGPVVWGTAANFNGFCVLASLLQRRRSMEANQTLNDVWLVHCMNIFWGYCTVTEFWYVQNSLCVNVLGSFILAALLCGTRAAAVKQTL